MLEDDGSIIELDDTAILLEEGNTVEELNAINELLLEEGNTVEELNAINELLLLTIDELD
jgi:hypothetical protein